MSDDFFTLPVGNDGGDGGGPAGEGAPGGSAPSRSDLLEQRLEKLTQTVERMTTNMTGRDYASERQAERSQLYRTLNDEVAKTQVELKAAENRMAEIYDTGDGKQIAEAHRIVSQLVAKSERLIAEGRQRLAQFDRETEAGKKASPDIDTSNLDMWKQRNGWYGTDAEMTRKAHEIDAEIRRAGVIVDGSVEYFSKIDAEMAKAFPNKLRGSPGAASNSSGMASGGAGGVTRVRRDIAESWRKMGFDVNDPKVLKSLMDARQTAVGKGILPAQPVEGRVIER